MYFKRSLRRRRRNSESLPLLTITPFANLNAENLNEQQAAHVGQQQEQVPLQQLPRQEQQQQENDDLESIDLESQTSDRESDRDVVNVPTTKWFEKLFRKK